jgi:hypothetical protein
MAQQQPATHSQVEETQSFVVKIAKKKKGP